MARVYKKSGRKGKTTKKKRMVKSGFTRQVGFYGRYNGTPGWEKKWFDFNLPATPIPAGGHVFPTMNLIPQNTLSNGRIGRKVVLTNLSFNYYLAKAVDSPFAAFRVTVVLDKQCNGAAATQGDVFQDPGDLTSYLNLVNTNRFVILYDKYVDINSQVVQQSTIGGGITITNTSMIVTRHQKWTKRVNIPLEFSDGAVPTIANVKSNNIFVIVNCGAGGGANSNIDGMFRLRFSDS